MNNRRAFTGGEILLAITIAGLLGYGATKTLPIFNGDSKRAAKGEETTAQLIAAQQAPAAANTASAQVIGQAASKLPDSPAASFIRNEVPIMLARGPAPDATELLAAEKRLNAYLTGQLDEARRLNASALKDAAQLQRELTEAVAAKKEADAAITVAAAEKLAANRIAIGAGVLAILLLAAFVWMRMHASGLSGMLQKLVPVIDEHATPSLLGSLSRSFDAGEKRLIHLARANIKK